MVAQYSTLSQDASGVALATSGHLGVFDDGQALAPGRIHAVPKGGTG